MEQINTLNSSEQETKFEGELKQVCRLVIEKQPLMTAATMKANGKRESYMGHKPFQIDIDMAVYS